MKVHKISNVNRALDTLKAIDVSAAFFVPLVLTFQSVYLGLNS